MLPAPAYSRSIMAQPSWFARIGDVALFLVGALMSAAGVFVVAAEPSRVVLFLLGAGLMVMGALLPRLSGTIKISPGAVELTVIQQLEATRREAEQHVPDRVEEAVGLAFQRLLDSGVLAGVPMPQDISGRSAPPGPAPAALPAPPGAEHDHDGARPPAAAPASVPASATIPLPPARTPEHVAAARGPRGLLVGLGLAAALLVGALAASLVWGPWAMAPWLLAIGAGVVVAGLLATLASTRRAERVQPSYPAESPDVFARRIVEEMVARHGAQSQ